mgnify:CR=1 FL=1
MRKEIKRLTTAQFAKLHEVNKRTLHYYDEIGLFRPLTKAENGYRYYDISQSIDFEYIRDEYQNNINELEVLIKKERNKLSKEKDDKKISSINKKIKNVIDKENKIKDDLKGIELFVEKYYDKSYKLKEEYAERIDKDLIDMFRIGILKKYKSEKIALRESTLLTVLDYLRKLNWD